MKWWESSNVLLWMVRVSVVVFGLMAISGGIMAKTPYMAWLGAYVIGYLLLFEPVTYFHRRGQVGLKNVFNVINLLYALLSVAFGTLGLLLVGFGIVRALVMFKLPSRARPIQTQ